LAAVSNSFPCLSNDGAGQWIADWAVTAMTTSARWRWAAAAAGLAAEPVRWGSVCTAGCCGCEPPAVAEICGAALCGSSCSRMALLAAGLADNLELLLR